MMPLALVSFVGASVPSPALGIVPPEHIEAAPRARGYPDDYEFAVAVSFRDASGSQLLWCSGVLVSPRHAATASHCFDDAPGTASVLVGVSVDASEDVEASDWQETGDVTQTDNHWWFPASDWRDGLGPDITLVTLDYAVPFVEWARLLPSYLQGYGQLAASDTWLRDPALPGVFPILEPEAILAGHSWFTKALNEKDGYAHYGTASAYHLVWDGVSLSYSAGPLDYWLGFGDSGGGLFLYPSGDEFWPYVLPGQAIAGGIASEVWLGTTWSSTNQVFPVWFPLVTSPYDAVLYATDFVKVNDRATVDGILVGDRAELGVGANVGPVITSDEGLNDRGAAYDGWYTADAIQGHDWWGLAWYPPPVDTTCDRRSTVLNFVPGTPNNMSGQTLDPYFAYGGLHLYTGTEVTLASGIYYFDELFLEPDSALHFDTVNGPVFVLVSGQLANHRGSFGTPEQAEQVFVFVETDPDIDLEGTFNGTLAAPMSKIVLNSPGYYYGAFWGKDIETHQGSSIGVYSVPFIQDGLAWLAASPWSMCSALPDASLPRLHVTGNLHIYNDYSTSGGDSIDVPIDEYAYIRLDEEGRFVHTVSGCHQTNREVYVTADLHFSAATDGALDYWAGVSLYEHGDVQWDSGGACRRVDRDGYATYAAPEPLLLGGTSGFTYEMTNDEPADGDSSSGWIQVSYECPEAGCATGAACVSNEQCLSQNCSGGICVDTCTEESAEDLGVAGNWVTVNNAGCVRIRDGLGADWLTRSVSFRAWEGTFPVPISWQSDCTASGGGVLTGNWSSVQVGPVSRQCATVIDLQGSGSGDVTVSYN